LDDLRPEPKAPRGRFKSAARAVGRPHASGGRAQLPLRPQLRVPVAVGEATLAPAPARSRARRARQSRARRSPGSPAALSSVGAPVGVSRQGSPCSSHSRTVGAIPARRRPRTPPSRPRAGRCARCDPGTRQSWPRPARSGRRGRGAGRPRCAIPWACSCRSGRRAGPPPRARPGRPRSAHPRRRARPRFSFSVRLTPASPRHAARPRRGGPPWAAHSRPGLGRGRPARPAPRASTWRTCPGVDAPHARLVARDVVHHGLNHMRLHPDLVHVGVGGATEVMRRPAGQPVGVRGLLPTGRLRPRPRRTRVPEACRASCRPPCRTAPERPLWPDRTGERRGAARSSCARPGAPDRLVEVQLRPPHGPDLLAALAGEHERSDDGVEVPRPVRRPPHGRQLGLAQDRTRSRDFSSRFVVPSTGLASAMPSPIATYELGIEPTFWADAPAAQQWPS
jgi:hypothetical protein